MLSSLLICAFDSLTDNRPTPYALSWPNDFDEWKETPVKEDAALWSPVTYRDGGLRVRGQTEANITQVHAVVLDYDSKQVPVTLGQAREVWQGWEHVGYTTFQHAVDKPRFRIVLGSAEP
jgi:hypothetical protein